MRLWDYVKESRLPFGVGVVCVVLEALCDLLGPTLMASLINEGIEGGSLAQVARWGGWMLLVTALGACFAVVRSVLASFVSQKAGARLREDLFRRIMNVSEAGADTIESGSLITRLSNDSSQVVLFINGIMRVFLKAPITCVGSIALASWLNLRLSLIIYAVVAVVMGLIVLSMKLSYPRFARLQIAVDKVNAVVQEYLIGVRLVKGFGAFDEETRRFAGANESLRERGVSAQMVVTLVGPLLGLTVGMGTALVIWAGHSLFLQGRANVGDITAFTVYMAQILISLMVITNVFNVFVRTRASTARLSEIFNSPADFASSALSAPADPLPPACSLEFDNLGFAYPGGSGVAALSGVSALVPAGSSLAVIGPTGSGKSTLAWLLMRFYDPDQGRILLNGRDLRLWSVETARRAVALAPQKAVIFSGTVADNLRWGRPGADDDAMWQALDKAQADFVRDMPGGLEAVLGSGGVNLSGGQKQRISLARCFLKDAPILLLDDATSALDAITEARLRRVIMSEGKTLVLITQRCAAAMGANQILVLENGGVAGLGGHQQLLRTCPAYADIYCSQIGGGLCHGE